MDSPTKDLLICVAVLALSGCARQPSAGEPHKGGYYDQDARREMFFECLKVLPAGPQATKYNDWSEVVSECGSQAASISQCGYTNTLCAAKVEKP